MTTYILLRKNKESGPFSLQELKSHGVLHNDLLWVEGQSVCWLSPGEIRELKELVGTEPIKEPEYLSRFQPPEELVQQGSDNSNILLSEEKITPLKAYTVKDNFLPSDKQDTDIAETRYSKPLDEIKTLYLKNLEKQQRKGRFVLSIPPLVKKAAPYAAFLFVGLTAGILINKKGKPKNQIIPAEKPIARNQEAITPDTAAFLLPKGQNETANEPVEPVAEPEQKPVTREEPQTEPARATKKAKQSEPSVIIDKEPASPPEKSEKPVRNPETKSEPVSAADISSQISAKTNDYQVGSFGGIKNLQITVRNDSEQPLEQVTVELRYLKPADELLRTENIYFYSLPPRSSHTQAVPKSSRGVKVTCRVVRIEPKQAGTAGL